MKSDNYKRKVFDDVTNVDSSIVHNYKKRITTDAFEMMPIRSDPIPHTSLQVQSSIYLQNVHPGLAMFKHDLKTDKMSLVIESCFRKLNPAVTQAYHIQN